MEIKDELTQEEYIKLQGLRTIHENLEKRQEDIRKSVESIFDKIIDIEENENRDFKLSGLATDSMMSKKGLDKFLREKSIEVKEGEKKNDRQ